MKAPCVHFGLCGGCSSQHIPYDQQLVKKERFVEECLQDLPKDLFQPILSSPDLYFYRNKMEFSFGDEKDLEILSKNRKFDPPPPGPLPKGEGNQSTSHLNVHLGLHPKGRFALVTPTPECLLLSQESQKILEVVSAWATDYNIPVYVRKNNKGVLRHLVIREGKNTGERLVNLVATSDLSNVEDVAHRLKALTPIITTFLWTAHDGLSDVALGEVKSIFWGEGFIHERFGPLRVRVAPFSFAQTNTRAFENLIRLLYQWVLEERGDQKGDTLFDLYCGSGAIGLNLATLFQKLVGIELNQTAVQDAKRNALENHCENVEFVHGKIEDQIKTISFPDPRQTTVVVDPPRAGLHAQVGQALLEWGAKSLYYISCNPVSLARDLQALVARYRILTVQPMDFFPHTDHVETAVRLQLK